MIKCFPNQQSYLESSGMKRSSNLELYRIIVMLLIVAHHYVVSSGLTLQDGPIVTDFPSPKSIFLLLFGIWGKTGINCFLMITGYFMCTKQITFKKYLKLLLEIYFYKIIIYIVFLITGYESLSFFNLMRVVLPIWGVNGNFVDCYLVFFLAIPFLNILIHNLSSKQHLLLIVLVLFVYTVLGSIPRFDIVFNYVTWFAVVYLIASFIRLHTQPVFEKTVLWGWLTIFLCLLAVFCVYFLQRYMKAGFFPVSDCNKIFAVAIAISSFLFFKNIHINQSKFINTIAASTFGVLLIHANSGAMRVWLWNDTFDVVGHYSYLSLIGEVFFSIGVVLLVFIICNLIDQLRIIVLEKPFFKWYGKCLSNKIDVFVNKVLR